MNTEANKYFTLRFKNTDGLHKSGDVLACGFDTLHIGQMENCELRLPNTSSFEDEQIAVIKRNAGIDGWHVIAISPFIDVMVNGERVEMQRYLTDGDHITFNDIRQEIVFNTHCDNRIDASNCIIVKPLITKGMKIVTWAVLFVFVLSVFFGMYIVQTSEEINTLMNERVRSSVFMMRVDSIKLVKVIDDQVVECCGTTLGYSEGSAFLTRDSLLITARHCIEPWLNNKFIYKAMSSQTYIDSLDKPIKFAIQAETYNNAFRHDTVMDVVSYVSIMNQDSIICKMKSSDFLMNKSRDDIREFGDFDNVYYWRSIERHNDYTDMMLGDIAVCRFNDKGWVRLPRKPLMCRFFEHQGRHIELFGYPNYSAKGCTNISTEVSLNVEKNEYGGFGMIAHGGDLYPGFSGGPAVMRKGLRCYAVGVISVADKNGGERSYSVPITEIDYILKGGKDDGK